MHRRRLLAVGTAVALAGCATTVDRATEPEPDELLREAIETRTGMETLAGRRTIVADGDDGGMERTDRIVERPPAKRRTEVLAATNATVSAGDVSVTTRPVTWEYDSSTGIATENHHPHRFFTDRVRLTLEAFREECCLTYEGTDTVAGRDVHLIEVVPPVDADVERSIDITVGDTQYVLPIAEVPPEDLEDAEVTRTMAITDDERYPIEERDVVTVEGTELHSLTAAFEELSIDGGVDDDAFEYEPPANADIEIDGIEPEGIYDAPAAAEADVPYDLPEPEIPEPYVLDRVTVVEKLDQLTTTLWYLDPERTERELQVQVREEPRFDPDALDRVEIDGHEAYYRDGRIESVFWNCEELSYEVSSPDVAEPAMAIAASVGCN